MPDLFEYRVTYRRQAWQASTASKARTFARKTDADRFANRLLWGRGRPDLSPVSSARVDRRPVGRWEAA